MPLRKFDKLLLRKINAKEAVIALCVVIIMCIYLGMHERNKNNRIESFLIYEGPFEEDIFIQILVTTDKELEKHLKLYDIDADVQGIDFSKEAVFICSMHEACEFSYNTQNTKKNGLEILDVIFNKECKDKIYIYILEKSDIICWEASGAYKENVFR